MKARKKVMGTMTMRTRLLRRVLSRKMAQEEVSFH